MPFEHINKLKKAKNIAIIYDNSGQHDLRSIPLLMKIGFFNFTYPFTWRQIEQRPRTDLGLYYFLSSRAEIENIPNPLVVITTQLWEQRYAFNSIRPLINKAVATNSKLVLVCDTPRFQLAASHRPLVEEEFVTERLINYRELYCDLAFHSQFSILDSKNVFLQECALFMELNRGFRSSSINDFHANVLKTPENPYWLFWGNIFKTKETFSIPVNLEESGVLNYVSRRLEFAKRTTKSFIFQLRGLPAAYLDTESSESIKAIKSNKALELYQTIIREYNLKNEYR